MSNEQAWKFRFYDFLHPFGSQLFIHELGSLKEVREMLDHKTVAFTKTANCALLYPLKTLEPAGGIEPSTC